MLYDGDDSDDRDGGDAKLKYSSLSILVPLAASSENPG